MNGSAARRKHVTSWRNNIKTSSETNEKSFPSVLKKSFPSFFLELTRTVREEKFGNVFEISHLFSAPKRPQQIESEFIMCLIQTHYNCCFRFVARWGQKPISATRIFCLTLALPTKESASGAPHSLLGRRKARTLAARSVFLTMVAQMAWSQTTPLYKIQQHRLAPRTHVADAIASTLLRDGEGRRAR